jgi:hypothetical protein
MLWTEHLPAGNLLSTRPNRLSASPARGLVRGRTRHFGFQNTPFYWETKNIFRDRGPKIRAMTRRSLGVGVATINNGPTTGQQRANNGQCTSGWTTTGQLGPGTNRKRKENAVGYIYNIIYSLNFICSLNFIQYLK